MKRTTLVKLIACTGIFVAGCSQPSQSAKNPNSAKTGEHKDEHAHGPGPHAGLIFDLGKYHGEFVVDHAKQEVTIYIFGSDEKTPKPIAAEKLDLTMKSPAFTVELKPMPLDGESAGKSSRFVGKHEKLSKEQEFEGTVIAVIDGKPSQGEFKEDDHKDAKSGEKKDGKSDGK